MARMNTLSDPIRDEAKRPAAPFRKPESCAGGGWTLLVDEWPPENVTVIVTNGVQCTIASWHTVHDETVKRWWTIPERVDGDSFPIRCGPRWTNIVAWRPFPKCDELY